MKKILLTSKFLVISGAISLIALVTISTSNNSLSNQQAKFYKLASGMNICFQRVSQTFNALMLRDISSTYLTKDFKTATGECFSQISSGLVATKSTTDTLNTKLNNLMSDYHWFGQKVERVAQKTTEGNVDLFQSNVISKYQDLESLKMDVEEGLLNAGAAVDKTKTLAMIGLILSQLVLIFAVVALVFKRKLISKGLEDVEALVKKNQKKSDEHVLAQKVLQRFFQSFDIPKTQAFVTNYVNDIIEENYRIKDHLIKANTIGERVDVTDLVKPENNIEGEQSIIKTQDCDFSQALNAVIERVKEKAFNHGIILDLDVSDDFHVKSNGEALEQFLFYMVSFAMDSSLGHNQGRKVIIKGKPLGGIAYCKIKIAGHAFTDEEFKVINGKDPDQDTNINLILLKELISDSGARLAVKNKNNAESGITESEMEILFDRAQVDQKLAKSNKKIFKGSKKDLAEYFKNSEVSL